MNNKEAYIPGVIIGGVAAGILSAIPFINWVNCCFCAWMVGGGILAVMMVQKKAGVVPEPGEGALVGAIAGLICGVIAGGLGALFSLVADYNPAAGMPGDNPVADLGAAAIAALTFCVSILVYPPFGAGGGALGSLIFKKKQEQGGGSGFGGPPPSQGGFGGPPPSQGGFGPPPQQGGGFGPPPQQGGGFGPPPQQGGGGFPPPPGGGGQPPQGGGGFPPSQ